jgi:hypothetical protein
MSVETRNFKMHPKLLMDVIKRQAGSLAKAVLEGVMNGVDAGATRIEIALTPKKLTITDNGRGFESRQQIERFFEVFGQPPEEDERKTYGTFRMGRGQLFAYGRSLWTTNGWRMDVDVNTRGLDYDLIQQPANNTTGCTIEVDLYEELLPSAEAETQRCVERWCRYVPVAVLFNGRQVNVDPGEEKWDHITDEAYVRLKKTGVLEIYNLGIHVMDIAGHIYGAGGVVVSRRQLKVNFARNDIQSDCPVWRKIKPLVNQIATRTNTRTKSLNDDARQRLADQIRGGEISLTDYENLKLKVITGVTGRHFSIDNLLRAHQVTVAPLGDAIGERIHLSNRAFVMAESTLERFGFAAARQLITFLLKRAPDWFSDPPKVLDFEKLKSEINDSYELLPEGELTSNEKVWLSLVRSMWQELRMEECDGYPRCPDRTMHIGQGPAHGWTDASSYVAIGRDFLKRQNVDLGGIIAVSAVLIHEGCHEEADLTAHAHDQTFYELFHDALHRWQPAMVVKAVSDLPQILADEGKRMTKAQLKRADALVKSRRQAALNSESMDR